MTMSEFINNSEFRTQKLKSIIKKLHEGYPFEEVKAEFEEHFGQVSTQEISQIEQTLVKEGLPVEEIQRLCNVHAAVFKGSIADIHGLSNFEFNVGHPIHTLLQENKALEKLISDEINPQVEKYFQKPNNHNHLLLRISFDRLAKIDDHYVKKELAIFPLLEKHGITAPPRVMWGVDDEIRALIKEVSQILSSVEIDLKLLKEKIETTLSEVTEMIYKENNILFPLTSQTFTVYEWYKISESLHDFPFFLIDPPATWKPKIDKENIPEEKVLIEGDIALKVGSLSVSELQAILNVLPLDITFIDAEDKVKFFSHLDERVFYRPPTIIGRDVALCHPPASVHIVEELVNSFKEGRKNSEDFWIQMGDLFVLIRYFAVRDPEGKYLGTIEVTQNIKPLRDLQGEKRLLDRSK